LSWRAIQKKARGKTHTPRAKTQNDEDPQDLTHPLGKGKGRDIDVKGRVVGLMLRRLAVLLNLN
jgi:hypothetical protein